MKLSRIFAVVLILTAVVWIGSGVIGKSDHPAEQTADRASDMTPEPRVRFKVGVLDTIVESHMPSVTLSGRTEADRRASAIARTAGVIVDLKVRRGSVVKQGQLIATLSDEARKAQMDQAKARLEQRQIELRARLKLIEQGVYPAINQPSLEAELRAAEAGVAQAKAENEKGTVVAPVSGVVNTVPVETGQALQVGAVVAEIVSLDPMLMVVEATERQLGGLRVGDKAEVRLVTGARANGVVRFISRSASAQTRTYRVDIEIANADGTIPDGITGTVTLNLASINATRVPRSALTFSAAGRLIVRTVDADGKVVAVSVSIVEDQLEYVWLGGIPDGARVIVQGQDFVKEGEMVDAVALTGNL
jgi:multidrug efflux system membrane fusion protein